MVNNEGCSPIMRLFSSTKSSPILVVIFTGPLYGILLLRENSYSVSFYWPQLGFRTIHKRRRLNIFYAEARLERVPRVPGTRRIFEIYVEAPVKF